MPKFVGIDVSGFPVSHIFSVGADSEVPFGTLICDGSTLSRISYAKLFAIIGTTWGSPDGNTFNLPDLRGRTLVGSGNGPGLTNRSTGQFFGEETHVLSVAELASHNHSDLGHAHGVYDPGHGHSWLSGQGFAAGGGQVYARNEAGFNVAAPVTASGTGIGIYAGTANINFNGSSAPHNNMQPSSVGQYVIAFI